MRVKPVILIIIVSFITISGCIKETYNMDRLSKKGSFSPTLALQAVKGEISLEDMVEPNDTVVYDNDKFVRIIFREDSIIDFKMADFYNLDDMVSFSESYTIGELSISPFSGSVSFSVNEISQKFTPPVTFSSGSYPNFPSFPLTNIGEKTFNPFPDFEYATFSGGSIDIFVSNNLPVVLYGATIKLINTTTLVQIGPDINIPSINPGEAGAGYLDLTNRTIPNSIKAVVVLNGSPGTTSPVMIDLVNTNIGIEIAGRDLKVRSGRVILPVQTISTLDNSDTIDFDPGDNIEIDIIKILTGNLTYTIQDGTPLRASVNLTLPTSDRGGIPVSESLEINPNSVSSGTISMAGTTIDLGAVAAHPYNKLPLNYSIAISSDNSMVTFNSTDEISLELALSDPEFDYVKGYFGQEGETIDPDSLDLEIGDILNHITGTFLVSDPIIRLNYKNSFAIPIEIDLNATGSRNTQSVDLDLDPFVLSYPSAPAERDKSGTFMINRDNSELPELISLPPEKIRFSGSASMNPLGNTGARDNYIFGDSRFIGSLEVEVPMEFRISNFHFADTVGNFLKDEDGDDDSPVSAEDFNYLRIDVTVVNGFPLGISLSMSLYDSVTGTKKATVDAKDLIKAAKTDANGKAIEPVESVTNIEITDTFWNAVNSSDEIIFSFTMSTSGDGLKDVKIYSDYKIKFSAAVVIKPEFKFE